MERVFNFFSKTFDVIGGSFGALDGAPSRLARRGWRARVRITEVAL